MFGVKADTAQTLNVVDQTPAPEPEPEPEPDPDPTPDPDEPSGDVTGTGTKADPFVITTLPYEVTYSGNYDYYFKLALSEDATIAITYTDGALAADLPEGWEKNSETMTYTFNVTAGQALVINLWTMRTSGEFSYTIKKAEPTVEPEPDPDPTPDPEQPGEGGGNQGGEAAGDIDGTYVCDHTESGTSVSIVFTNCTATEGTVAITRVSSWGSVTTYNCTYTIDATGKGTLAEINGGGTPYGAFFMFDASGKPLTYTYSGTEYVLEKQ
jgi:hypothetical protein